MAASHADIVATRLIAGGAAALAFSVFADSGLEHYRGSFANPTMVLPIGSAVLGLTMNGRRSAKPESSGSEVPTISHVGSAAIGVIGLGFHVSIMLLMVVGPFSPISMTLYICLFHPIEYKNFYQMAKFQWQLRFAKNNSKFADDST